MSQFIERAKSMAARNGLESRQHGAGVEMWKGAFKLFVSPGKRPCRVNIEATGNGGPLGVQNGVEWVVLEAMCRNVGAQ